MADEVHRPGTPLHGGIVISNEMNEIVWLAVSGKALLAYALPRLDGTKKISVQTFDGTVAEGLRAGKLYESFGFRDHTSGGVNPAGIPTAIMRREP